VANRVYGEVEELNKQGSPPDLKAPIYNSLEEPEYAKADKAGPLYNDHEGPEVRDQYGALDGKIEESPCYHVLEGPFPEGAPVYDFLEGPESDKAPVYGSLDGKDPHGTLNMADTKGASEGNRGYDDTVYHSVGDVINEQGDIYQQLNQNGQQDSDVYQALSHPEKSMHSKELNESHSNA
jgi:hypothetical protein